jgi:hypothetical protein
MDKATADTIVNTLRGRKVCDQVVAVERQHPWSWKSDAPRGGTGEWHVSIEPLWMYPEHIEALVEIAEGGPYTLEFNASGDLDRPGAFIIRED